MSYQQLTLDERYQIQALRALGASQAKVARRLKRHRSTIARELRRNRRRYPPMVYQAEWASEQARRRRRDKGERSRKIQGELQALVEQKLRQSWSPEQVSGRLLLERGLRLSHETIYQHVLRDSRKQGILRYCLRFGGYKHHRFKKSKCAERTRLRRNGLDERPAAANERRELGHWERDCILGQRGSSALLTIVDRRSRFTRIRRVPRLQADSVADATVHALRPFRKLSKTMTNDNGTEFQRDESLQRRLAIPIYFTDPASPWQRGSVENANGLVRQYCPKRTNFDALPSWAPKALEETLNFRPRKTLGYLTPHEVFFRERLPLTTNPKLRFGLEFSTLS